MQTFEHNDDLKYHWPKYFTMLFLTLLWDFTKSRATEAM